MEYLESFALEGGYLELSSEEIPKHLEGVEYWKRYFDRMSKDAAQEIDTVFIHYGWD